MPTHEVVARTAQESGVLDAGIDDQLMARTIAVYGEADLLSGVNHHEPAGDRHAPAFDDLVRDRGRVAQDAEVGVDQQGAATVD